MQAKKVLMVIANNKFQDYEYSKPRAVLEGLGCEVEVASSKGGECVGCFGLRVSDSKSIAEVSGGSYDAVVFVGGPGAPEEFLGNDEYLHLAKEAKIIGAICIAPMLISDSGVVKGKKLTSWNRDADKQKKYIEGNGGIFVDQPVVVDGNLITANGPESAEEFGKALAREILARKA